MALTQADADAIKKAIASGVRSVTFADGRAVQYQSVDEMKQALALANADIAAAAGSSANSSLATFCRD
jgi:multidrug resistance efflux pump